MPNHAAGALCPAIAELQSALRGIPDLAGVALGTIRHDGSRHTAGLAIDIMLHSRRPAEKAKADRIIAALIDMHPQMQWFDLIYTDWNPDGTPFHFHIPGNRLYAGRHLQKSPVGAQTGAAHINHIHLDWCNYRMRIKPDETTYVYDWPPEARRTGFGYPFMATFATVTP